MPGRRQWAVATAALALLGVAVVLSAPRVLGTSEVAPENAEPGDISIDESGDGHVLLTVVGMGHSGLFACDRLVVTDTSPQADDYVVRLRLSPLAYACNDDALPLVVQVEVPKEDLADVSGIAVFQGGAMVGFEPYQGLR